MIQETKFSIGIDLGTTNCALASLDHESEESEVAKPFMVPQLIDQSTTDPQSTLPSFLYHPTAHEDESGVFKLPWDTDAKLLAGVHARNQGEKTPQRLTSSAKSWLCTPSGRTNKVLPLAAPEEIEKVSAVDASASYLNHLKVAWNHENPEQKLEDQQVVLTVPASFDAVARDLTLEAAYQAGLGEVTLLEEPIAAFYAWLADHADDWRDQITVGDVILVCDIGGGTTDFSLISVSEEEGNLKLSRIAVGEHILLGGDNMDYALARNVQLKIEESGKKIEQWQFLGLAHGCRKAKESLLSDPSLDEMTVVVPSRGSRLLGKTLSSKITRDDLNNALTNGFFTPCEVTDHPKAVRRAGLRSVGLDYASDSSILKHLAKFLTDAIKYVEPNSDLAKAVQSQSFLHPTAILFNGGVSKADVVQKQVVQSVNQWLAGAGAEPCKELAVGSADLAVSLGASYYGTVVRGKGVRIKSATLFPYYLGVESPMPAIPGMPPPIEGLCVAPAGLEEGSSVQIPNLEFGLVLGETVDFQFFMGKERPQDQIGAVVQNPEEALEELSTLEVQLPQQESGTDDNSIINVRLRVTLTELGALELWCDSTSDDRSWKLEFNLRDEG